MLQAKHMTPKNAVYNPDIWLAKFESGFNNANET